MKRTFLLLTAVIFLLASAGDVLAVQKKKVNKPSKKIAKQIKKLHKKAAVKKPAKKAPVKKTVIKRTVIEIPSSAPWFPPAPAPVAHRTRPAASYADSGYSSLNVKTGMTAGLFSAAAEMDWSISGMIPGAKVRIGTDFISGTNPRGNDNVRVLNMKLGGTLSINSIASRLRLPGDWYIGSTYMVPVKVNEARTGKYGVEAFIGGSSYIEGLGVLFGEIGYCGLKYVDSAAIPALKGLNINIGYGYVF